VNTATTFNTGPPQGRGPARPGMSHPEETSQVWAEAGFLPPAGYRQVVALLHCLAMAEKPVTPLLSCALTAAERRRNADRTQRYRIQDTERLRRIAKEYGIEPAGRGDEEIAHAVTLAIISEYGNEIRLPADREGRA
jgi:Trp operon repressor